jgi:kinetochore-associated protein 1
MGRNLFQKEKRGNLVLEMNKTISRLTSFRLLGYEGTQFWGHDWHTFRNSNMLYNIQYAIANHDVPCAIMLLRRHAQEEKLASQALYLMGELPRSMSIHATRLIVREFKELAALDWETSTKIDEWILETALAVERIDQDPYKTLSLLNISLQNPPPSQPITPSLNVKHLIILSKQGVYQNGDLLAQIKFVAKEVSDILQLAEDHDFRITLSEYEACTPTIIAHSFLERVSAPELLPIAISTNVAPFCEKHNLQLDEVLSEYCKEGMDSSDGHFTSYSIWEPRVLTLLDEISNSNLKYSILLDVMRRTCIPWSQSLEMHIQNMLKLSELRTWAESVEQYKLMRLKAMVQRYGIKTFNVADTKMANRLVPYILRHTDILTAIEDSIQCVEAYNQFNASEIVIMRSQFLIDAERIQRLECLLNSGQEDKDQPVLGVTQDEKAHIFDELSIWIEFKVNRLSMKESSSVEKFKTYLAAALVIIRDPEMINKIERCMNLTNLLNAKISPDRLKNEIFRQDILSKALSTSNNASESFRLGELLGYDRSSIISLSARFLAQEGKFEKVTSNPKSGVLDLQGT